MNNDILVFLDDKWEHVKCCASIDIEIKSIKETNIKINTHYSKNFKKEALNNLELGETYKFKIISADNFEFEKEFEIVKITKKYHNDNKEYKKNLETLRLDKSIDGIVSDYYPMYTITYHLK